MPKTRGKASVAWHLAIDETGRFEDRAQSVAVAGFLSRDGLRAVNALKRAFRSALPTIPWPVHGRLLVHPLFEPWIVFAQDAKARDAAALELAEAARRSIQEVEPSAWTSLVKCPRRALSRRLDDAKAALGRTRAGSEILVSLETRAHGRRERAAGILQRLFEEAEDEAPGSALLVFAGEDRRAAAAEGEPPNAVDSTRYLRLLRLAFRRAALHVASQGGGSLTALVASRKVADETLGAVVKLNKPLVRGLAEEALASIPNVSIDDVSVVDFEDGETDPRLVVADLSAYRGGRAMGRRKWPLAEVEEQIERFCGLPTRDVPHGGGPLTAAFGQCSRRIDATLAHRDDERGPTDPKAALWAVQQADEWIGRIETGGIR